MTTPLADIIDRLEHEGTDALPVIDLHGRYRGTVTAAQLEAGARDDAVEVTAADLATLTATVTVDQTLDEALQALVANDRTGLPVLDREAVTGWLTHSDVLRAYSDSVHTGGITAIAERERVGASNASMTGPSAPGSNDVAQPVPSRKEADDDQTRPGHPHRRHVTSPRR
jgi:CBS domain-containing protein